MKQNTSLSARGGGAGILTIIALLFREALPERRGTFFRPLVYERVGISLAEVYHRVGKSVRLYSVYELALESGKGYWISELC